MNKHNCLRLIAALMLLAIFTPAVYSNDGFWKKTTQIKGAYPTVAQIFREIAGMEGGVIRNVAVNALDGEVLDGVKFLYDAQNEYFTVSIGEDDGSGDMPWERLDAKLWRVKGSPLMLVATYYVDSSPQEEHRYLYFYQYDTDSKELKRIPLPFKIEIDPEGLRYELPRFGRSIDVTFYGAPYCTLRWDGSRFTPTY